MYVKNESFWNGFVGNKREMHFSLKNSVQSSMCNPIKFSKVEFNFSRKSNQSIIFQSSLKFQPPQRGSMSEVAQ